MAKRAAQLLYGPVLVPVPVTALFCGDASNSHNAGVMKVNAAEYKCEVKTNYWHYCQTENNLARASKSFERQISKRTVCPAALQPCSHIQVKVHKYSL